MRQINYLAKCLSQCGLSIIDRMTFKNRNLFLIVLEAGSLRSGCQPGLVKVRAVFRIADGHVLLYPHKAEGTRKKPQGALL